MIRALAIETSGRLGSVALAEDGVARAARQFEHGLKHAAEMVPMIDGLCRARGWNAGDFEELYVSAGPGSFTGLRIGITLAKTLTLATAVKLVAVPSVRVLAENAPAEATRVVIVLDAKREQIYTAMFERAEGGWREIEGAHLDGLTAMLERAGRPVWLVGEGMPFHQKFVPADERVIVVEPERWRARAEVVARLGYEMARRGEFADAMTLTPIYIRPPEAEEKLGGKSG